MIIVGLGNPGEQYEGTRHNAGRMAVESFAKKYDFDDFEFDKKSNALVATGKVGKVKTTLVLPETFMNKSGLSVKSFVKNLKQAKSLIVVHDDLDIGLGRAKMSWNKSSGGHKGVESVMKAISTEEFFRIRIGVIPTNAKGAPKMPDVKDIVNDFIIGPFKPKEMDELKKVIKKVHQCLEIAVTDSPERAMSEGNANFNK